MNEQVCRNEYKYIINAKSAELIRRRLGALIDSDRHAAANGEYFIRSIYFDDGSLSAYHDKLAGVSIRNKFRIRFYNMELDRLCYEAKRKRDHFVTKDGVIISRKTAEAMLIGARLSESERRTPLLAEFDALSSSSRMRPSVIVDYMRTAFSYPVGDVRITLDRDLRAETFRMDNAFALRSSVPVSGYGEVVLEVKYGTYLPPLIAQSLSDVPKILCANSKYCNCLAVYL